MVLFHKGSELRIVVDDDESMYGRAMGPMGGADGGQYWSHKTAMYDAYCTPAQLPSGCTTGNEPTNMTCGSVSFYHHNT